MILAVPYHLDERLPDLPVAADAVLAPELTGADVWARLRSLHGAVADRVAAGARTVVSGDCLVTLGVVAGVQRAGVSPFLVWFDAHGDVHTLDSSTSGYLGGLALRLVLGAHPELTGTRGLAERDALLVDARDLDPAEVTYLAGAGLRRCAVSEVAGLLPPDRPIVLHVDVDTIDSAELPGLRVPAPGGPSRAAVLSAVRAVLATGQVVARHVACPWHPDQTGPLHADLLAALTA